MNKKPAAARKPAPANPRVKTQSASMKGSDKSGMSKPTKVSEDPRFIQAVQNYEAGLKAMQTHKYDRAKACFEKVMTGASPELADRAAVHLNTCNQHLSRASNHFKTPEEQYDYAISLMNMGDYVTARENFEALIEQVSQARLHLVRHGRVELPDGPLPRVHHQPERGDTAEPVQPLSGAQRLRLQKPGRRPALHRAALS